MFPLHSPANKGRLQKAACEVISALFVCSRYAGFPCRKPPSSRSVLCWQRGTALQRGERCCQGTAPGGGWLGTGSAPPHPLRGTHGPPRASGHSPASPRPELILSPTQSRCVLKERFWTPSRNKRTGCFLTTALPPCWNTLVFSKNSSVCKNLVLWQIF